MKINLLLILTLLVGSGKAQQNAEQNFYLTFGSCFESTSIDLKFNKQVVLNIKELTSNFSTGVVGNKRIVFDGSSLKYILSNREVDKQPLKISNNQLLLEVVSGGGVNTFKIDLKKGIYIFLEKCGPNKTFEIKQYKKPPIVE